MHEGPYRENAKPKQLPLFNVNIAFKKENTHAHVAKQLRAKDRLEALDMFISELKISKDNVWSWDVVKVEEEEK